mgnify:CR=1 FL=1
MILCPDGQPLGVAVSAYRPAGAIIVDGHQVADTMQCCHCGEHFVMVRGSGRRRGFCLKCKGVTCGKDTCCACRPIEQRLEERERRGSDSA